MRLLYVKTGLKWPRASGHDVYTFHMIRACAELGHEVSLATADTPEGKAVEGLRLHEHVRLSAPLTQEHPPVLGTWLQRKFRSYWGIDDHWLLALREAVQRLKPQAVIVVGLDGLPYLPALTDTSRIWFP